MDGQGSKWTVFRLKADGLNESKDKNGRSINVKVDGQKELKWTVLESKRLKANDPEV